MKTTTFDQGLALLAATFRDLKINREQLKTWRILLSDLDDEDFSAGIVRICREHKEIYPGTNIVALIRTESEFYAALPLTAEEAWLEVTKAVVNIGHTGKPKFKEQAIQSAVDSLGWRQICLTDESQVNTLRAHFFKVFDAFKNRAKNVIENNEVKQLLGALLKALPGA